MLLMFMLVLSLQKIYYHYAITISHVVHVIWRATIK